MQLERMCNSKLLIAFFFFIISIAFSCSTSFNSTCICSTQQALALFQFKQRHSSTYDAGSQYPCCQSFGSRYNYPITLKWKMNTDCCMWDGVTCDHFTGDVIALDLSCGLLRGSIQANSTLFHLPRLQKINLSYNLFDGSQLPHEISRFYNRLISLDLSYSGIQIQPYIVSNLLQNSSRLRELSVAYVNLTWILPNYLNITSSLKELDLSNNDLQGKFPDNILSLPYLEKLNLERTNLAGRLPKVNRSTVISLKWLDVSGTSLSSGEMFNSISHLKSLNYLDLSGTNLFGDIPNSIGDLKSISYLDLSYTNLSGGLPNNIGVLKSLNELILSKTGLCGEIPESIGQLMSLNKLDLSATLLSGKIPYSIGHLKSLKTLRLNDCALNGSIPKSLGTLKHLTEVDLSNNMLTGTLPSSLFSISSLDTISLDKNKFIGSIPSEFLTHESLKIVSLSFNSFVGPISQPIGSRLNFICLDLSNNNFTGTWELDTLVSSLTNLDLLDLSYSGLIVVSHNANYNVSVSSNIEALRLASCKLMMFPESLKAMQKLFVLDLSYNEIHGDIPKWVGELMLLQFLDLSHNFITGFPHLKIGLEYLYLRSNLIQGPIPPSVCDMYLMSLDLSNNNINGVIPECIATIMYDLGMLNLGNNRLHGTIPNKDMIPCGQLTGLMLNGNQFEGEVPSMLSSCEYLEVLDLGNNHFNGSFPASLGALQRLRVLVLKSNKFHGHVESSAEIKLPFPRLRVLDLSHNGFVGPLSSKYFQNFNDMKNVVKGPVPKYLEIGMSYYSLDCTVKGIDLHLPKLNVDYTMIDLSDNGFENEIPDIIGSLNSLIVLNLSHNHLTGRIPLSLGRLTEIESLDLSWNQLIGDIPQSLADITSLEVLNLSLNNLSGRIPVGKQFNTFEANAFGGNTKLCGVPLPKKCEHQKPIDNEDTESGFSWRLPVMLGYGCGNVLGLVMGYLMMLTGRPKWFNAIAEAGERMIQKRLKKRRYYVSIRK